MAVLQDNTVPEIGLDEACDVAAAPHAKVMEEPSIRLAAGHFERDGVRVNAEFKSGGTRPHRFAGEGAIALPPGRFAPAAERAGLVTLDVP